MGRVVKLSEKEHLVRYRLKNGEIVDFHRQDGDVIISSGNDQVTLPNATGQQTLDMAALFEGLGGILEDSEETEGGA